MTITELFKNYEFHDSLLNKIEYNKAKKTLTLSIDLCYFMQKNYKDDDPENGTIKIVFKDIEDYNNLNGDFSTLSILETKLKDDDCISFNILDDMTNDFYMIDIKSSSAIVKCHK